MRPLFRPLWRLVMLSVLGVLACGLSHCACETSVSPSSGACQALRATYDQKNAAWDQIQLDIKAGTYGCLQAAYEKDGTLTKARTTLVRYKNDNAIYGQCSTPEKPWDCSPAISLPAEASGEVVRLRLYFFSPTLADTAAGERCKGLETKLDAGCLPDEDCALMMEFKSPLDGYKSHPIDNDPEKACKFTFVGQHSEPTAEVTPEPSTEPPPGPDAAEPQPERMPELVPEAEPVPELPPEIECKAREMRQCYTGPSGSRGFGLCKGGTQTCTAGVWGRCLNEVLPTFEVCDGLDNDCNGPVDDECAFHSSAGGPKADQAFAAVPASSGGAFLTGSLGAGRVVFGPSFRDATSLRQTFVAKVSAKGAWNTSQLAPQGPMGSNGVAYDEGLSIAATSGGPLIVGGHFRLPLYIPFNAKKTPMIPAGSPGQPPGSLYPSDGYIALLNDRLGWMYAIQVGGEGDDMISSIVCCRMQVRKQTSETVFYALGIHRDPPTGKSAIKFGRDTFLSIPYPSGLATTPLNSSVFLIEMRLNVSGGLYIVQARYLALWNAPVSAGNVTMAEGLPQMALVPGKDAEHTILYITFSAKTVTGSAVQLLDGLKPSAEPGRTSYLLRVDVNKGTMALANSIEQKWFLPLSSPGASDAVRVRTLAARVRPSDPTVVDLALAGSFQGKASLGRVLTSKGSSDLFVGRFVDENMGQKATWLWTLQAGGSHAEQANALAFRGASEIFVTGSSQGELQVPIIPGQIKGLTKAADPQLLFAKIEEDPLAKTASWSWIMGAGGVGEGSGHALFTRARDVFLIGTYEPEKFFQSSVQGYVAGKGASVFVTKNPHVPLNLQ